MPLGLLPVIINSFGFSLGVSVILFILLAVRFISPFASIVADLFSIPFEFISMLVSDVISPLFITSSFVFIFISPVPVASILSSFFRAISEYMSIFELDVISPLFINSPSVSISTSPLAFILLPVSFFNPHWDCKFIPPCDCISPAFTISLIVFIVISLPSVLASILFVFSISPSESISMFDFDVISPLFDTLSFAVIVISPSSVVSIFIPSLLTSPALSIFTIPLAIILPSLSTKSPCEFISIPSKSYTKCGSLLIFTPQPSSVVTIVILSAYMLWLISTAGYFCFISCAPVSSVYPSSLHPACPCVPSNTDVISSVS